jgi:hypothetical protein
MILSQIKNPYCYKYSDYIVKIRFEDTKVTLIDSLKELVLKTVNSVCHYVIIKSL